MTNEKSKVIITDKQYSGLDSNSTIWYTCLNCESNNVSEYYRFCPDCGFEIVWKLSPEDYE